MPTGLYLGLYVNFLPDYNEGSENQNKINNQDSQDSEPITVPRVPVKEDMFLSFQPPTEADVRNLIKKKSPNKQCSSDPIPTWLLKECLILCFPY